MITSVLHTSLTAEWKMDWKEKRLQPRKPIKVAVIQEEKGRPELRQDSGAA